MSGVLSTHRTAIDTRLKALDYFKTITILTEEKGDVANSVNVALGTATLNATKAGMVILILTARAEVKTPNVPGPYLEPITIVVHVEENVLINQGASGTKLVCSDVAEQVANALHRHIPTGETRPFIVQRIANAQPMFGDIAYAVTVTTAGGITAAT